MQLCSKVDDNNYSVLEKLSEELDLSQLSLHCASHILRIEGVETYNKEAKKLHQMMRMDLSHHIVETSSKGIALKNGVSMGTYIEEKENNGECSNA